MRSASRRVERRWAMRIVVRPAISSRRVAWMASSVVASTAEVASSSTRIRGSVSDGPGQGDALALTAREREAPLADDGVVARRAGPR